MIDTNKINEGNINLYYTNERFDKRLLSKNLDDINQGTSNIFIVNNNYKGNLNIEGTLSACNLIIEGDTIIDSNFVELFDSLIRFNRLSHQTDMDVIGFGNPWQNRNLNGPKIEDIWTDVTPFIPAQSYLITQNKINKIKHLLENTPWDAIDLWMCNVAKLRIGTAEKIYTKHLPGYSIIEQTVKDGKTDNPLIFLEE